MDFSIDAAEVKLLAERLGKAGLKVQIAGVAVLRKTALNIQRTAQGIVPVRTGTLKNSISVELGGSILGGTAIATVGPTAHYGGYVEEGTSKMAPRPYMRPALQAHQDEFTAALGKLMEGL